MSSVVARSPLDVYAALRGPGGQELVDNAWRYLIDERFLRKATIMDFAAEDAAGHFRTVGPKHAAVNAPRGGPDWRTPMDYGDRDFVASALAVSLPRATPYAELLEQVPHIMACGIIPALDAGKDPIRPHMPARELTPFWQGWLAALDQLIAGKRTYARNVPGAFMSAATAGMPVLRKVADWARERWQPGLGNVRLCAVQHLIPDAPDSAIVGFAPACTNEQMFGVLENFGVERYWSRVLGKHYSAGANVVHAMQGRGWHVDPLSLAIVPPNNACADAPAAAHAAAARRQLHAMFTAMYPQDIPHYRYLILDDGGALIRALHADPELRRFAHLCFCVEQTTSGLNAIADLELLCPVVSVASADPKIQLEAPIIGESAYDSIKYELAPEQWDALRRVVVLGYGTVGSAVAARFRDAGLTVVVDDVDLAALQRAENAGFIVHRNGQGACDHEKTMGDASLLIVASNTPVDEELAGHLPKGAIVANLSSGQNSFKAKTTYLPIHNGGGWYGQPDRTVLVETDKTHYFVLRSGFVMNFRRETPRAFIQLTRSLVLAGCLQSSRETTPGIKPLDPELSSFIADAYVADVKARGLDPMKPDFEKARRG